VISIEGVDYLTADEAASQLGVKLPTLYAYVSRGRLASYRQGERRRRLYRRAEVASLAGLGGLEARRTRADLPRAEDWIPLTG
jgi:citrate synthase